MLHYKIQETAQGQTNHPIGKKTGIEGCFNIFIPAQDSLDRRCRRIKQLKKDCIKQKADYFFKNATGSSLQHAYIRSDSLNQHSQKTRDLHIESNAHTTEFLRFLKTFGTCFDPN